MTIALVYPPCCDPTAPYLSVPALTGYLRAHGVTVTPIDANVMAFDHLLRRESLRPLARRLERRLAVLEARDRLGHEEQLEYHALWSARGDAEFAPRAVDEAVATLRDPTRFYDPACYDRAVQAISSAMRLIGAAHYPLHVDFTAYRTPFSLLDAAEIRYDAGPERDPFHEVFAGPLAERIRASGARVVGISVAFPGQIQPAYSLAHTLRAVLPDVHLVVGGPAITQILVRLSGERLLNALGPFHTVVLFEGEEALLELVRTVERGEVPARVIRGNQRTDMTALPSPDFDGLDLDRYFAPEVVLPYDPTRGCYWGVCTFCHYGLAEVGTAGYRERHLDQIALHLEALSAKHGARVFYFSQDAMSPKLALKLARLVRESGHPWRWATDMRPERSLTPERCVELAEGGALGMALGVETGSDRVAALIDKGIAVSVVEDAIRHMAAAGLAAEAMCFTDFPSETHAEAAATLDLLARHADEISLFFCGVFDLTHGALVAQKPGQFGIRDAWEVAGDELGTGLFFEERRRSKSDDERARIDSEIARLSAAWLSRPYPWAGSLSTAHTLLWYDKGGAGVFRALADQPAAPAPPSRTAPARFDLGAIERDANEREGEIWHELVRVRRAVSRALYRELVAKDDEPLEPRPRRWRYQALAAPTPAGGAPRRAGRSRQGRRPSTAGNALKKAT